LQQFRLLINHLVGVAIALEGDKTNALDKIDAPLSSLLIVN